MNDNEKFLQEMHCATLERTIKRQWITIILLIVLLAGTYAGFIWYESQFVETETTQTIEAEQQADNGTNMIVGGDYGKSESESNNNN